MSNRRRVGRWTVGRLMGLNAALAALLAAWIYHDQNADVERAGVSNHLWALRHGDAQARQEAADDLGARQAPARQQIIPALAEAAGGDSAPAVRAAAVGSLGGIITPTGPNLPWGQLVPNLAEADLLPARVILRALGDPAPAVRIAAVGAANRVRGAGLVTPELDAVLGAKLVGFFSDPDPATRRMLVNGLASARLPAGTRERVLDLARHDPDLYVRVWAIQALILGWPSPGLYPLLLARYPLAPSDEERDTILRTLAWQVLPPPESIGPLMALLETDRRARRPISQILLRLGAEVTPWLGALGRQAEQEIRAYPTDHSLTVLAVLVQLAPRSPEALAVVVPLSQRLRDETDASQWESHARLLQRYGPAAAPALPTYRAILRSPLANLRVVGLRLIGALGPAGESARADLEALRAHDPESYVRAAAQHALDRLHPD